MGKEAKEILTRYWGFSQFRPMQEEIIDSVLLGRDTFALLPTGGGKSLTFQIPALIKPGCCLVITPLVALMKDQVDRLRKMNIPARALYTGLYYNEIESIFSNAIHNKLKFLYVSPERLMNPAFQLALAKINVNLIAVDEAHCISQWGYNFRPPYLRIAEIRTFFPNVPVLALTATATPRVVEDIMDKLRFKLANVFRSSFERRNLAYRAYKENDKISRIIHLLRNTKGTAIVYVRSRKKTRELSEILLKNKMPATSYHAGLDNSMRSRRQHAWNLGQIRIMVATNAFGMGIDKPDVRQVIHYNLPDCLESYFQEAGRAGRDGKPAVASLLFNNQDIGHAKKQLTESFPDIETIRNIYNALGNYFNIPEGSGKDMGYNFKITDFVNYYGFGLLTAYNAIKLLEKEGFIAFDESAGHYSRMKILLNNEQLYRFIVENVKFERLLKEILRSYGGLFTDYVNIYEKQIAKRTEMKPESVIAALSYLSKLKIISYFPLKSQPQIFYNTVRLPIENIGFSKENYRNLKDAAAQRLEALIDFLNNNRECRSIHLLRYFGEARGNRCGICDVCLSVNETGLNAFEFEQIESKIKTLLSNNARHLYEIIPFVPDFEEDKILSVIEWLLDNGTLIRQKDERLRLFDELKLEL
ncbi:MAG: ATP-dependent DNA helicase RecQ [bacterium]|nr:MAG: ATP-dependent DNA helicase RecQ [bacterium]